MPRRSILSTIEIDNLLAPPSDEGELIRHYTFSEADLSIIRQHRGASNRLGFAIQLCYMRYPGMTLSVGQQPFPPLLEFVARQLKVSVQSWEDYGQREQTRREHLVELQAAFGFKLFTMIYYRQVVKNLTELALQSDKGMVLAVALVKDLRERKIILPPKATIERAIAEAVTHADRRIYRTLTKSLTVPLSR